MTTIVYKDGVLAGDTRVCYQGMIFGETTKIFELEHVIFGGAGSIAATQEFKKFLEGLEYNKEIFKVPEHSSDFIVIDKKSQEVTLYDQNLVPEPMRAEYIAIGSGSGFAYGALRMGASPREAISIASEFDYKTNNNINEIRIICQ